MSQSEAVNGDSECVDSFGGERNGKPVVGLCMGPDRKEQGGMIRR